MLTAGKSGMYGEDISTLTAENIATLDDETQYLMGKAYLRKLDDHIKQKALDYSIQECDVCRLLIPNTSQLYNDFRRLEGMVKKMEEEYKMRTHRAAQKMFTAQSDS